MPILRFLGPVLLGFLLTACAAENGYHASNIVNPSGSTTLQQPVGAQGSPNAPDTKKVESKEPEKIGPGQSANALRAALQKKTDPTKGMEAGNTLLQETDDQAQQMSLFIRNGDGEEEDLSSLLTADYLRQFDIPIVFNDAVQYFVRYFTNDKRKIMANWLKRSRRYVPMIKEILREQGLPEDLIYLAMIESGFNPKAYSSMKACGPWQFIYETGGRYGLRVTHWVDERRDPEKSTVAAALYLKDLFNQFGNWYLAAAGYNAGEKRIERAVERHETSDFWELSKYNTLPRETREYIPRLLAAAIIAKDPERFGFTNINYDQPVRFINEKVPGATPLAVLAKAASTDVTTLRALNPELLTGITPPDADDYSIKLPEWVKTTKFQEDLKAAVEGGDRVQQVISYTCKRRDTLAAVMRLHRVTYNELMLVNSCDQTLTAKRGSVIYIPRFSRETDADPMETETAVTAPEAAPVAKAEPKLESPIHVRLAYVNPAKTARVASKAAATDPRSDFHIVKKGEKLADISEKYGITLATLKGLNKLKKNQIYPNMRLELTASRVKKTERPVVPAVYHTSKKGHTIAGKAAKYDTSTQGLKEKSHPKRKGGIRSAMKPKTKSRKATGAARG